ncbi:NADP-dependent oxidoreductase [Salibacterium aidingense]|uniref:NADP-dependent oxidoreductase n=1 Tax=Salibacterium aidingense TaxID=384933 RepID=UPI003BC72F37
MIKQMKASVFHRFGGAGEMQIMQVPVPDINKNQIRVKVKAAGLQPVDVKIRSGFFKDMAIDSPQLLGNEFSGVVDEVGLDVTKITKGDEVIGWATLSAHAEHVVVNPHQVVKKPLLMSWEEAGALSASGQTALMALKTINVSKGDTLIVHAAAGGVGTMAVQLAKARGAKVIGSAREANHNYLRKLGAIPITYEDHLVENVKELAPQGVDAALDAAGPEALYASLKLGASHDRIVTIASRHLVEETGVKTVKGERTQAQLNQLTQLVEEGRLHVYIRKSFNLDEIVEAHREVESGHGYGKVVLTMTQ